MQGRAVSLFPRLRSEGDRETVPSKVASLLWVRATRRAGRRLRAELRAQLRAELRQTTRVGSRGIALA